MFIRWSVKRAKRLYRVWTILYVLNALKFLQGVDNPNFLGQLTERDKCPFCYGTEACPLFDEHKIHVSYQHVLGRLFNEKNIYHAFVNDKRVVLKKFASDVELLRFDETVASSARGFVNCLSGKCVIDEDTIVEEMLELVTLGMDNADAKLRVCPKTDNFYKEFVVKYIEESKNVDVAYINLWTTMQINPEPFLLNILSRDVGWPVPKYYGSCGRLALVENVGPTLFAHYYDPWLRRAKIALSLLDAAHTLTFKNPKFAVYLTDVSPDNIAVDDKDEAKFIDLENVIIVDRTSNTDKRSNSVYRSETIENRDDWFAFSPTNICLHKISDHNYFSVCQILWQRNIAKLYGINFLHSVPREVLQRFPELLDLVRQCSRPDDALDNRIYFGIKLSNLLKNILSHYDVANSGK